MTSVKPKNLLVKSQQEIARKVRALRLARKLSQHALAGQLGLSQNRLSEIERGDGSFSAEQFLLILQLFNIPATEFVDREEPALELQNALARLGASHLHETTSVLPSEQLGERSHVVREALIDGSPRFVTALGPILVRHARAINLSQLQAELARIGFERRLPWLVANTLAAIEVLRDQLATSWSLGGKRKPPNKLVLQTASLQLFVNYFETHIPVGSPSPPDVLDATIRTAKSVEQVLRNGSDLSRRWNIVTRLTPDDFVPPLTVLIVEN
jgi:transcriptional regulator with XRE-family HTH domain